MHEVEYEVVTVARTGRVIARANSRAQQWIEPLANDLTLEMIAIAGGTFLMGSPETTAFGESRAFEDEQPQHAVTVAPFLIGKYLITQQQWDAVVGPETHSSRCRGARRPIDCVSWEDAQTFCRELSARTGHHYRLPSEAEWEYACRAGTSTPFHYGHTITTELANYNGEFTFAAEPPGINRHVSTEVGTFPPNAFGLYDMHGNLWEWCADPWHDNYRGAPADSRIWEAGGHPMMGVLRGGAWHDTPQVCRSAVRLKQARIGGDDLFGFRVAMTPPASS